MDQLVLVEHRLRRIHREDEFLLVEEETRAKLVMSPGVVRIELRVVFPLKNGADYGEVPNGNISPINRYRVVVVRVRGQLRWCHGEIGQNILHRRINSHSLESR